MSSEKKYQRELPKGLHTYLRTVHKAHALGTRGSQRLPEDEGGLKSFPPRGDHQGLNFQFLKAQAPVARPPQL